MSNRCLWQFSIFGFFLEIISWEGTSFFTGRGFHFSVGELLLGRQWLMRGGAQKIHGMGRVPPYVLPVTPAVIRGNTVVIL